MISCPQCARENPPDAQFCMRCGAALFRPCPSCGTSNPLDAHFCLQCGTPLAEGVQVERRVLSVLFADLVASTPLATRLDPETMRVLIAEYFSAMRGEVERHGGVVEKFIGDAVMSVFGLPAAHEDDPERAVRAAVAMQAGMPALNVRLNADLHIRIGISTGEVIADPRAVASGEFMVTGDVVNHAARLQEQAPPDGIAVDERTYHTTRHRAHYRPLPPAADGDFATRARWQVVGLAEGPAAKRLRAPMVGREDEVRFLLALYRRMTEGRKPQLATIIGAAGVGKTRLVEEFLDRLRGATVPAVVRQGRCPAYGEGLTYRPLAEMLKEECGIKDNDPAAVMSEKLRTRILAVCGPLLGAEESETIAADLASVLGIKVPTRPTSPGTHDLRSAGDALLRSLRAFLIARAQEAPLLMVFEDLHWAEESLLDLLRHLAIRGGNAPILILCLARPELLERHPEWGAGIRNYTAVALAPLDRELSRRLMMELLRNEAVPVDVRDAILAKAEGNPLFIQEILRMLIDGGGLVQEDGGWRWATHPLEIRIPDTIHGILASRLDLLSALEKRAIQDASVAGRRFWLGALAATSELTAAEAAAALARLQERDLVEERATSSVAGEREFVFTHALIRQVAYATLPKVLRSTKHLRFAEWLERMVGDRDEFLGVLAHHSEQAWRYKFETGEKATDLARSAVAALRKAGARATALRTFPEARRLYDRALSIVQNAGLKDDASLFLELLTHRTEVVKWLSSPDLVLKDTDTVLQLAPEIGREDLLARAWLNRAFAEYDRDRLQPAEEALRSALELFGKLNDRQGKAEALEILGAVIEGLRGNLSSAQAAYMDALDLYREMGDGQGMARTMAWHGRAVMNSGNFEEARTVLSQAVELARTHHERISESYALAALATLAHLTGDSATAVRRFHEAIALRQELGDPMAEAGIRRHLGMHHLRWGRLDEAEQEFQMALVLQREHGAKHESDMLLRGLAEVYLARGDLLAAAEHAERALAIVSEQDEIGRATLGATLGKIRAAQGRGEEAEELFRQSLETLERREYRIDLALTLLKYGEALLSLGQPERAQQALGRARDLFAGLGATHLVQEADARLRSPGGVARPAV